MKMSFFQYLQSLIERTPDLYLRELKADLVELERSPMERVKRIPVTDGNQ